MRLSIRRVFPVALVALFLALMVGAPASAHATYEDSDPGDDSTVSSAPSSVWAEFSETLAKGSYLRVYDPCGTQVDDGNIEISIDGYRMSVGMSSTLQGKFTVRFLANSAVDGHATGGEFTFTSSSGDSCVAEEEEKQEDKPTAEQPSEDVSEDETIDQTESTAEEAPRADETKTNEKIASTSGSRKDGGGDGGRKKVEVELAADQLPEDPGEPSLLGDMPWGSFALALVFAALIGAAGGKVYAGIMGPRA